MLRHCGFGFPAEGEKMGLVRRGSAVEMPMSTNEDSSYAPRARVKKKPHALMLMMLRSPMIYTILVGRWCGTIIQSIYNVLIQCYSFLFVPFL